MRSKKANGKWTLHYIGQMGEPERFNDRWYAERRAKELMLLDYTIRWEKHYHTRVSERMKHAIKALEAGHKIKTLMWSECDSMDRHLIKFPNGEELRLNDDHIHKLRLLGKVTDESFVRIQ